MALKTMRPRLPTAILSTIKPMPKRADPIYSTTNYRDWRRLIITRAGGRCQAPGCDRRQGRMFADHIVEIRDNGSRFDPANGQCLCGRHHTLKTNAERAKRMGPG